jgi:hypothetical protein
MLLSTATDWKHFSVGFFYVLGMPLPPLRCSSVGLCVAISRKKTGGFPLPSLMQKCFVVHEIVFLYQLSKIKYY